MLSLQCLYCEKTFRDKTTLKDHMRKKAHRRINSNNREYDRFYVINYLVKPRQVHVGWVGCAQWCFCSPSLSGVRSWGRPGRRCRARMTASWWTMTIMSNDLQRETFCVSCFLFHTSNPLTCVCSDWSDWQAHPVSAVCLFCDHQSETMEQIYTHMKVRCFQCDVTPTWRWVHRDKRIKNKTFPAVSSGGSRL